MGTTIIYTLPSLIPYASEYGGVSNWKPVRAATAVLEHVYDQRVSFTVI